MREARSRWERVRAENRTALVGGGVGEKYGEGLGLRGVVNGRTGEVDGGGRHG